METTKPASEVHRNSRVKSLKLRQKSRVLDVEFADGAKASLPLEYLRVFSPSAEVRGHGQLEPTLIPGKRMVSVSKIDPVGQYAVRLVFDDGHNTGLFTWSILRELSAQFETNWARYLARLEEHGMSRDSEITKLSALGPKKWSPKGNLH